MSSDGPTRQSASYVRGSTGARFRLVSEPLDAELRGAVLWAHPFAEELNKSRRMCARMARLLASRGWRVVQTDLSGCGDSSGEFRDASWQAWGEDLASELRQLEAIGPCWLWGVRAGALFASELTALRTDLNLLLWQPALQGALVLQQFLRLHAGARIVGAPPANDDTASPAQRLKAGQTVEVGGYEISSALAGGLQRATFDLAPGHNGRVVWLEVSAAHPPALSPPARDAGQRMQQRGVQVMQEAVAGPMFWQTQEIEDCDALLQRSIELITEASPA
jgi:exosortase A-associated hydrolase 2